MQINSLSVGLYIYMVTLYTKIWLLTNMSEQYIYYSSLFSLLR